MSIIQVFGTLFDAQLDGTNLSSYNFYCYDIKKPLSPKQTQKTIDIPKRPGLIQVTKKFESYQLILNGYVEATSLTTTLQTLSGALRSDDDVKLILSNATDRYWNVQYLDSRVIEQRDTYALVDLIFTCNDPFGYAITEDINNTDITIPGTTYLVTNGGHYYARPVITITFNQPQTHIYVQSNNVVGNRFDIAKSFLANDELEIDCKNETVKLNGNFSPSGFGDGGMIKAEFLLLNTGLNELQVGTDDDTLNISISLRWRKVYLY